MAERACIRELIVVPHLLAFVLQCFHTLTPADVKVFHCGTHEFAAFLVQLQAAAPDGY